MKNRFRRVNNTQQSYDTLGRRFVKIVMDGGVLERNGSAGVS